MSKLVIFKIGAGDFESGFPVTLRIESDGNWLPDIDGHLPPAPMIPEQYSEWRSNYSTKGLEFRALEAVEGQVKNISVVELSGNLRDSLKQWLNDLGREFIPIREGLFKNLNETDDIRFIVQAQNQLLLRLPWHRCDLFESYDAEVAITPPYQLAAKQPKRLKDKVRILVILGLDSDINVQADLDILKEEVPDAEIVPLIATSREQLYNQLWEQEGDILFFAGHSSSDFTNGQGTFYINKNEGITIEKLKYCLGNAIEKGLKLAIFNSCDGLGLAQGLADLQMPAIVVMRERIPDGAAQKFLEFFLQAFAQDGMHLHASVREARKRLYGLEDKYPCASWLPVICQHPDTETLTWNDFLAVEDRDEMVPPKLPQPSIWQSLRTALLTSLAIAGTAIGVRSLDLLQPWELKAYDQLMRQRPLNELPDSRLLLITNDENDVESQDPEERGAASLSDRSLSKVLSILEQYNPRVIGLLNYRENPVKEEYESLAKSMRQSDSLIGLCKYGNDSNSGVLPPPEISAERQGFSNVLLDADMIIRRNLLAVSSPSPCQNFYSFSFMLARRYLADEGIEITSTPDKYLQLGETVFKTLEKNIGGSHDRKPQGHQIMLNYRASGEIASTITLTDVLKGQFNPDLVRDRIVIIGTIAPSFNNHRWLTPYSGGQLPIKEFTGIEVQAHMVSQIISTVLDNRPLILKWSDFGEIVWVLCWSLVGGILAWRFQSLRHLLPAGVIALGILYVSCLYLLIQGRWVPLIPPVLALVGTGGVAYILFQKKQEHKTYTETLNVGGTAPKIGYR